MNGLYIEKRELNLNLSLSTDLARHMYTRQLKGNIAVVAKKPSNLQASVKKQWDKLIRQMRAESSSTLDASRILELSQGIGRMLTAKFLTKLPDQYSTNNIVFATPEQFLKDPPICHTLYVACPLDKQAMHLISSWMPERGLVVVYAAV